MSGLAWISPAGVTVGLGWQGRGVLTVCVHVYLKGGGLFFSHVVGDGLRRHVLILGVADIIYSVFR